MNMNELTSEQRKAILHLAEKYGASNVRIVGSVARGEATPTSDVDILVTFPVNKSVFNLVGLWLDLTELLEHEVSLLTDDSVEGEFKATLERDAVPL